MVDEVTVGRCFHIDLSSSTISIIPETFHTPLLLQGDVTGKTKGRSLRTFQRAMVFRKLKTIRQKSTCT